MTRFHPGERDRDALRRALARHPVHDIPPEGSEYAFGRVHRDRASLKGYTLELKKAARRLLARGRGQPGAARRLLIVARPRSGSTLLVDLLSQVPGMRCDREVLHHAVARPAGLLRDLAEGCDRDAYGCKLLSYQMFEIQRMRDPLSFLEAVAAQGYRFVHLRRQTFPQSLSLARALETNVYELREGHGRAEPDEMTIDPAGFARLHAWNAAMLDYEDLLMSAVPHLRIDYETDLATDGAQQTTVERICEMLGHPPGPVSARLRRQSEAGGGRVVNLEALKAAVAEPGAGQGAAVPGLRNR